MERDPRLFDNLREYRAELRVRPGESKTGPVSLRGWFVSLSHPPSVRADEAGDIMRDDDYVIGFSYKGVTQASPLWLVDYYHSINQSVGGEPVVLFS